MTQTHFIRSAALFLCALLAACGNEASNTPPAPTVPLPPPAAFAQQKNCLACHTANAKMVGPSWISISERYKDDKDAATKLTDKVLKGGSGSFGQVVMPPQMTHLTPDEAKYLVQWVLSQKAP